MATKKKLLQAAAGAAAAGGAGGLNVEDVFSTYVFTGNNSTQTITNGIDLSGEGGLVWTKSRGAAEHPNLYDTERGVYKILRTTLTNAESTNTNSLTAFNTDGFTLGTGDNANYGTYDAASWTFRKAPKFFDVVTYTGDGTADRQINHNLGTTVGAMIIKQTSASGENWVFYHRSTGATGALYLNDTRNFLTADSFFNDTTPTSTNFTISNTYAVNRVGYNYVAYLFAHNDGDGDFGDGTQDIIKCGSFTDSGSSSTPTDVNLGFEPQWLLVKASSTSSDWYLLDMMREMSLNDGRHLRPNLSNAETNFSVGYFKPTPTGFQFRGDFFGSGQTAIYIAIRRGPMAVPTDATDVFAVDNGDGSSVPAWSSGFSVDLGIEKATGTDDWRISSRLSGETFMYTNQTSAEVSNQYRKFDYMDGWFSSAKSSSNYSWMWKRAPSFCDVVAYTGTGSNTTIQHNLGVKPEMIWVKNRDDGTYGWYVYHEAVTAADQLYLHLTNAAGGGFMNNTEPTDTVFTLGVTSGANASGQNHIAYLFASLDGVSKVGSYTGNGTSQTIDCGFSSGARFVLIKRSSNAQDWYIFDTERGIVAGNDPYLKLNTTDSEATAADEIDPLSSGFTVHQTGSAGINFNGHTYIFYAIA